MKTIHKYEIDITDTPVVSMPKFAKVRHFGVQNGKAFIWCEVDTDSPVVDHEFKLFGTGHPIINKYNSEMKYLGTIQLNGFVWHLYR